ncbi:hypothetical protein [uncultured Legionella sp.]|uniref:hypothetical protein n=1 Tax=uncultured Legionella sp. TaxID=210934 RepID=UPI00260675C0|nr:hypothetical protein [uncultured Legionella sp.]
MKKIITGSLLTLFITTASFAESTINTQTNSWKSIPITVDEDANTYTTAKDSLMPEGDYYYTFSGYRCLKNKSNVAGETPLILKPENGDGTEIYCYKDE